ncbi:hypothetical protein KY289_015482, partial [Solanum tuberosum]
LQVAFFTESNNTFVFKRLPSLRLSSSRFGTLVATSLDTLRRKTCEEMSCNQPNKLSRTKEQTLKEPPSVNIQENASNQIITSTCSSNKAKQLFPPFYAFEKGSTSNTCKAQQNVIPEVIYISGSTSNTCSEQQNVTPKVATKKGLDQRVYNLPSASEVKFNNMFWSKPHSLAPPPDSPSRIEEFEEADSSRNSDPRQAFQLYASNNITNTLHSFYRFPVELMSRVLPHTPIYFEMGFLFGSCSSFFPFSACFLPAPPSTDFRQNTSRAFSLMIVFGPPVYQSTAKAIEVATTSSQRCLCFVYSTVILHCQGN